MTVNNSELCVRWKDEAWSIPEISVLGSLVEYKLRRKGRVKEMGFQDNVVDLTRVLDLLN